MVSQFQCVGRKGGNLIIIFTLFLIDLFSYPVQWYIFNSVISLAGLLRIFSQRSTRWWLASSDNFSLNFVEKKKNFCVFHPLPACCCPPHPHPPPAPPTPQKRWSLYLFLSILLKYKKPFLAPGIHSCTIIWVPILWTWYSFAPWWLP